MHACVYDCMHTSIYRKGGSKFKYYLIEESNSGAKQKKTETT